MSSLPYAKLLVGMYWFSDDDCNAIAAMLTDEDKAAIREAIAALHSRSSGDRLQTIINHYYGIECERQTMRQIGESFEKPVTAGRVSDLRNKAQRYLCREVGLRPLLVRITEAGIVGNSFQVGVTMGLRTPVPSEELPVQTTEPTVPVPAFTRNFIIDCFPTCVQDKPCPSCRARTLLEHHGLSDEIVALADEWASGPGTDWRTTSLRSLYISERTTNCLINRDVRTLGQLCDMSASELLRLSNFGRRSLNEIKALLDTMNLRLRD